MSSSRGSAEDPKGSDGRNALRLQIEEAFADAAYPGDDRIADAPDHCDECRYTDEFFRGRHWRDVARADAGLPFTYIALLTREAQRYFLPAYLLASLGDGDGADAASDDAQYTLTPPDAPHLRARFEAFAAVFTPPQRTAFVAFLDYCHRKDPGGPRCRSRYELARAYWSAAPPGAS